MSSNATAYAQAMRQHCRARTEQARGRVSSNVCYAPLCRIAAHFPLSRPVALSLVSASAGCLSSGREAPAQRDSLQLQRFIALVAVSSDGKHYRDTLPLQH